MRFLAHSLALPRTACVVAALAVTPVVALAQSGSLAGLVTDSAKTPLPGAQVTVVGTRFGATSGLDGRYRVVGIPVGSYTIRVQRIGATARTFDNVAIAANGEAKLDVTMQATALPRSAAKRGSCRAPVCGGEAEGAVDGSSGSAPSGSLRSPSPPTRGALGERRRPRPRFAVRRHYRCAATSAAARRGDATMTPRFAVSVGPRPKSSGLPSRSHTVQPASSATRTPAAWSHAHSARDASRGIRR